MILGVHCDVRQGCVEALRRAESLGCEAMQIFTYRRHHEPGEDEFAAFREAFARSPLERLVLHVRYSPYLASDDRSRWRRSVDSLAREMLYAQALGGHWLVAHMGAYSPGSDAAKGTSLFVEGVRRAWEETGGKTRLLIENVPGGGRRLGGRLEELADVLEALRAGGADVRACIDTAHALAAGYELETSEDMWRFTARLHRLIGAENVPVFHLNDSRAQPGSHQENHAPWGRGYIGKEGLTALVGREEYRDAVWIIEAPDPASDEPNLAYVRKAAGS